MSEQDGIWSTVGGVGLSNTQSSPVVTKGKTEYLGLDAGRCIVAQWEYVEVLYN